jgi:hypothetical protein
MVQPDTETSREKRAGKKLKRKESGKEERRGGHTVREQAI